VGDGDSLVQVEYCGMVRIVYRKGIAGQLVSSRSADVTNESEPPK